MECSHCGPIDGRDQQVEQLKLDLYRMGESLRTEREHSARLLRDLRAKEARIQELNGRWARTNTFITDDDTFIMSQDQNGRWTIQLADPAYYYHYWGADASWVDPNDALTFDHLEDVWAALEQARKSYNSDLDTPIPYRPTDRCPANEVA